MHAIAIVYPLTATITAGGLAFARLTKTIAQNTIAQNTTSETV